MSFCIPRAGAWILWSKYTAILVEDATNITNRAPNSQYAVIRARYSDQAIAYAIFAEFSVRATDGTIHNPEEVFHKSNVTM